MPKKWLSQFFLKDANMLRKEVAIASVRGKNVLEIGAGDGRLTEKILDERPKKVYAVEKDSTFVEFLKDKFKDEKRIEIINADFLKLKPRKIDIIIGNIPYYITSPIIFKLKDYEFERAVLIVQKEFAEKMVAKPNEKNYGRLSVTTQLVFNVQLVQKIPKHLFLPQPKVDSALIMLTKNRKFRITEFEEEVIRILFQHRNKTVRNALLDSKLFARERLVDLGGFAKRRVRMLTKEECLKIAALL